MQNDLCGSRRQISLGIHPVWSKSWLCAQWVVKDPMFLHADSEDSDQTGPMPRLIWVFAGRKDHFVGFVMRQLICLFWLVHVVVGCSYDELSAVCYEVQGLAASQTYYAFSVSHVIKNLFCEACNQLQPQPTHHLRSSSAVWIQQLQED